MRFRIAAVALGGVLLLSSCGFFQRGPSEEESFAEHFTAYPGHVDGVKFEDVRLHTAEGRRYGIVHLRGTGLQEGGWNVMQGFLSDNLASAFRADPKLEAVMLVVNSDGYPPNQAAGYHREQVLGAESQG